MVAADVSQNVVFLAPHFQNGQGLSEPGVYTHHVNHLNLKQEFEVLRPFIAKYWKVLFKPFYMNAVQSQRQYSFYEYYEQLKVGWILQGDSAVWKPASAH